MRSQGLRHADGNELPSMLSTLCSYENLFGPYHPQTLRLMTEVGVACWRHGELAYARRLLERAIRDIGRVLGREHDTRLRAMTTLRDLLLQEGDYQKAGAVQRELWECQRQRLGPDHPETVTARDDLAAILLVAVEPAPIPQI